MTDLPKLTAAADALRRRNPAVLADLSLHFPQFGLTVAPGRPLGVENGEVQGGDIAALGKVLVTEAREDVSELVTFLASRARRIARWRLATGVASAVASASVVAMLLGQQNGQMLAGVVAFLASLGGLVVTYIEDFSGGAGSTAKLREAVTSQVRILASAEARIRVGQATGDNGAVLEAITQLNAVFGEIQALRAQLGLSI
jgi:hypothetical protein